MDEKLQAEHDLSRDYKPEIYNQSYFEGGEVAGLSSYDNYANCEGIVRDQFKIIHEIMWPKLENKTHLDVACAYGYGVDELYQRTWESSGMDVSPYAIDKAKSLFGDKFTVGDAIDAAFWESQEPVGLLTGIEFFEHIPSESVDVMLRWISTRTQWGVFVINARTYPGEDLHRIDTDHGHLNFHNFAWWVMKFAKYGDVDFRTMHEFNKRFEEYNASVGWHCRTMVVKFHD